MALVVWKVLGDQIVHIIGGVFEALIILPLWVWSYRRVCVPRRVLVEESVAPDKSKIKKWKVINDADADNYSRDEISGWRIGHWVMGAALLIVVLVTIFSY